MQESSAAQIKFSTYMHKCYFGTIFQETTKILSKSDSMYCLEMDESPSNYFIGWMFFDIIFQPIFFLLQMILLMRQK